MNGALWVELSGDIIIARDAGRAFGEGDYRVFYNDIAAAIRWLTESP